MLATSRRKGRAPATLGVASLIVGCLLALGSAPAQADETETPTTPGVPTVQVSQTAVPATGTTQVTITGTGFDPAAITATRPPLGASGGNPASSGGVYVAFGKFAPTWRPTDGAATSTRVNSDVRWAVLAGDMTKIGGTNAGAIELHTDGTFTATLTIDKTAIDTKTTPTDGRYGIYTYPGGGATNAAYETYTPITFTAPDPDPEPEPEPEPEPVLPTLSTSNAQSTRGLTVWATGTGFLQGEAASVCSGVYLGIAPSGGLPDVSSQAGMASFAASTYVASAQVVGGALNSSLTAPVSSLDPRLTYSLYTWCAHTHATSSQDTVTPLALDWSALTPTPDPEPEPDPQPEATSVQVAGTATMTHGRSRSITVGVTGESGPVDGTVSVSGGDVALTATLTAGTATVELPGSLPTGQRTLTVSYAGDDTHEPSSASVALVVTKATPRLGVALTKPTTRKGGSATATLRVDSTDLTGPVRVVVVRNGKTVVTKSKQAADGTVTVALPKLKAGSYELVVTYGGDANHESATTSKAFRIKA